MQQRAFCLFASEIGNATQNSNGIWLKSVQPPWSSTFQQSNQRWPAVAISPKIASVVNNVPRPTTIPENAKRIAGVYIAPPKRCIFCIMTGNPPLFIRSDCGFGFTRDRSRAVCVYLVQLDGWARVPGSLRFYFYHITYLDKLIRFLCSVSGRLLAVNGISPVFCLLNPTCLMAAIYISFLLV